MPRMHASRWVIIAVGLLLVSCAPAGGTPTVAPTVASAASAATRPVATRPPALPATASAVPTVAVPAGTATRAGATASAAPGTVGAGCDNAAMTALVARFLDTYNAGDQARLLAFFPAQAATRGVSKAGEERYFQRYWDVRKPSLRDEDGFAAYTRDDLPPYWAQRHAQHDYLQLRRLQYCGGDWTGGVGFVFELTRHADDLPTHTVVGKGEIDSDQGTIFVWSMGPQEQPATPTPTHP